jgi:hypothetical protein
VVITLPTKDSVRATAGGTDISQDPAAVSVRAARSGRRGPADFAAVPVVAGQVDAGGGGAAMYALPC